MNSLLLICIARLKSTRARTCSIRSTTGATLDLQSHCHRLMLSNQKWIFWATKEGRIRRHTEPPTTPATWANGLKLKPDSILQTALESPSTVFSQIKRHNTKAQKPNLRRAQSWAEWTKRLNRSKQAQAGSSYLYPNTTNLQRPRSHRSIRYLMNACKGTETRR